MHFNSCTLFFISFLAIGTCVPHLSPQSDQNPQDFSIEKPIHILPVETEVAPLNLDKLPLARQESEQTQEEKEAELVKKEAQGEPLSSTEKERIDKDGAEWLDKLGRMRDICMRIIEDKFDNEGAENEYNRENGIFTGSAF